MKLRGREREILLIAGIAAAGIYYVGKKAKETATEAAGAVGDAVNPTNPENIFYEGVNAVGGAISGQEHWTLGGAVYETFHG